MQKIARLSRGFVGLNRVQFGAHRVLFSYIPTRLIENKRNFHVPLREKLDAAASLDPLIGHRISNWGWPEYNQPIVLDLVRAIDFSFDIALSVLRKVPRNRQPKVLYVIMKSWLNQANIEALENSRKLFYVVREGRLIGGQDTVKQPIYMQLPFYRSLVLDLTDKNSPIRATKDIEYIAALNAFLEDILKDGFYAEGLILRSYLALMLVLHYRNVPDIDKLELLLEKIPSEIWTAPIAENALAALGRAGRTESIYKVYRTLNEVPNLKWTPFMYRFLVRQSSWDRNLQVFDAIVARYMKDLKTLENETLNNQKDSQHLCVVNTLILRHFSFTNQMERFDSFYGIVALTRNTDLELYTDVMKFYINTKDHEKFVNAVQDCMASGFDLTHAAVETIIRGLGRASRQDLIPDFLHELWCRGFQLDEMNYECLFKAYLMCHKNLGDLVGVIKKGHLILNEALFGKIIRILAENWSLELKSIWNAYLRKDLGLDPCLYHFTLLLKVLADTGNYEAAKEVLGDLEQTGLDYVNDTDIQPIIARINARLAML